MVIPLYHGQPYYMIIANYQTDTILQETILNPTGIPSLTAKKNGIAASLRCFFIIFVFKETTYVRRNTY